MKGEMEKHKPPSETCWGSGNKDSGYTKVFMELDAEDQDQPDVDQPGWKMELCLWVWLCLKEHQSNWKDSNNSQRVWVSPKAF